MLLLQAVGCGNADGGGAADTGADGGTSTEGGGALARVQCDAYLDCLESTGLPDLEAQAAEYAPGGRCDTLASGALSTCEARCHDELGDLLRMPEASGDACVEPDAMGVEYDEGVRFWSTIEPDLTCVARCVADDDPATAAVDAACDVVLETPEDGSHILPPCGAADVSPEIGACWTAITDAAQMSPECADEGWNLEIALTFDVDPPEGSSAAAYCRHSSQKSVDCPDLT